MSLEITPPYRNTDNDNVECVYFAIHNPVNVLVERKDFAVVDIQDDGSGNVQINVTGTLPTLTVGGKVYCYIGVFPNGFTGGGIFGYYDILSNTASAIVIDLAFSSVYTGGYVNLFTDRPNYHITTRFRPGPAILDITGVAPFSYHKAFTGIDDSDDYTMKGREIAVIDVAEYMRSRFSDTNISDYTILNWKDKSNCILFGVWFLEAWTDSVESYSSEYSFGAVNAAMQLQNDGGSNMKLYLPTNAGNDKAKFLSDSSRLRHWIGLPFDLHALLGPDLAGGSNGASLATHEVEYTRGTAGTVTNTPLVGISSFNNLIERVMLQGGYAAPVDRVNFSLYIDNTGITETNFTEELQIRLEYTIPCNPIYLYWRNKKGGFNYWCFSFRQLLGVKTSGEGDFIKAFMDLQDQYTTQSMLGKVIDPYMVVGDERLDAYDMLLMRSLIEARQAFMLMNLSSWQSAPLPLWQEVVVEPADYKLLDTKRVLNDCELKLRLPKLFNQRA